MPKNGRRPLCTDKEGVRHIGEDLSAVRGSVTGVTKSALATITGITTIVYIYI